jgi:hypothetical protein
MRAQFPFGNFMKSKMQESPKNKLQRIRDS